MNCKCGCISIYMAERLRLICFKGEVEFFLRVAGRHFEGLLGEKLLGRKESSSRNLFVGPVIKFSPDRRL